MILSGTETERIDRAIAFAKAHRCHEYDRDKVAEVYRAAGVPFTEAAERFCREWDGVFDRAKMYPARPNVVMDDGTHYLVSILFSFRLLAHSWRAKDPADELKCWYDADYMRRGGDGCSKWYADCVEYIRREYGADTVPVAEGGYYYPDIICVRPDGGIVSYLPDDGDDKQWDGIGEFLHTHIGGNGLSRIETVLDKRELDGAMDERIAGAIAFARAYGGFAHCRLFAEMYNTAPLDLRRLREREMTSDDEAAAILKILEEATPKWYRETALPCRIEFVAE